MTTSSPKVLVVEDNARWQGILVQGIEREGAQALVASSLEEGERLFEVHTDLALVTMDACVPGDRPNSMPLVKKMRQTFHGPIVAASSDFDFCKILMEAGCSHGAVKWEVPELVSKLLKEL